MGDFGRILEKWESGRNSDRSGDEQRDDQFDATVNAHLDRYPPPDEEDELSGTPPRERPDRVRVDDTIDLHGLQLHDALDATSRFIENAFQKRYRKVVVIHGKGENGDGVLKREVRAFLEKSPLTGTMGHPKGSDGGRGALWVMLRTESE
jgi:DNA-nicking Smr family endonuclease